MCLYTVNGCQKNIKKVYRRLWYAPSAYIIICGIIITCNESSKIIIIITIRRNETFPRRKMLFDVRVHIKY